LLLRLARLLQKAVEASADEDGTCAAFRARLLLPKERASMAFTHTHTITIRHRDGNVEKIAVDAGEHRLEQLAPGAKVPLHTREETVMEMPADWVYTAEEGLTFFGNSEGPYRAATYTVEPKPVS
jgi:hypothetical protein